jgi:hypothetical protein
MRASASVGSGDAVPLTGLEVLAWLENQGICSCPGGTLAGGRWAAQVGLASLDGSDFLSLGGLCIGGRGTTLELLVDLGIEETIHFRMWPAEHQGAPDGQQQLYDLAQDFVIECPESAWPWLQAHASALRALHPFDIEIELVLGGLGVRARGLEREGLPVLQRMVALWRASLPSVLGTLGARPIPADRDVLDSLFPLDTDRLSFAVATPRSAIGASEALQDQLITITAAYSGVVERVGDQEIARVSLDGHGIDGPDAPYRGELSVRLFASGHPRTIALDAALPAGLPRATLQPEVGLLGALAALRELEIGDRDLDKAFVIRGEGDVAGLLEDVRPELLRLAPLGLTLTTTGERLQLAIKSPREAHLERAIDALFTVWRRLAVLGLRLTGHR